LFLIAVTGSANAQDKPNVVLMLADNVGYGDIGAYGAGEVRGMPTPRIDSIASEGLRLTQYLVEPGCTPSRAAVVAARARPQAPHLEAGPVMGRLVPTPSFPCL
jgi:arylsulfatase